jgi:SAM-dependent methyltransferase
MDFQQSQLLLQQIQADLERSRHNTRQIQEDLHCLKSSQETTSDKKDTASKLANHNLNDKIGSYWSSVAKQSEDLRVRWWQSPHIIRHINKKIAGSPLDGFSAGIAQRAKEIAGDRFPFSRGVSIGCGSGQKEMALIRQGLVSSFDLYELSEVRIEQGRELASKLGVEDKVTFYLGDAFEIVKNKECFDFVHWNNSLHHMFDVEASIKWSYDVLRKGGMFYMDDYVGPTRFQWSDKMLEIVSKVRSVLPENYLVNPKNPNSLLPKHINRPRVEELIQIDPSEAADSERILDCVNKYFPNAEITLTGGVIYHLTLSDILHNFDESKDRYLLDILMIVDDLCAELGESTYATAIAVK